MNAENTSQSGIKLEKALKLRDIKIENEELKKKIE